MTISEGAQPTPTTDRPYRYQLVGPVVRGEDRYLLVDTQSADTPNGAFGAVIATICDAGIIAGQAIVAILNADEGRLPAIIDALVTDEPF